MKNDFKKTMRVLLPAAVLLTVSVSAGEVTPEMKSFVNRVDLGRQEVESRADALTQEGNRLLSEGQYFAARDKYLAAIAELNRYDTPLFKEKIEFCHKQIAKCYFNKATDAMEEADRLATSKDYEEAIAVLKEALKYCPEQSVKINSLIEKYTERRDMVANRESYSKDRLMPNLGTQEYQIQMLMEQGRKLFAAGELGAAHRKFQEVLLINPYNEEAMQNLSGVNCRIGKLGDERTTNMLRRNLAEAAWKLTVPIVPEGSSDDGTNVLANNPKVKRSDRNDRVSRKLDSIIIPRIEFEEFTVEAALRYLREQSRINDPEGVGVDIFQIVPPKQEITAAPAAENAAAPADQSQQANNASAAENAAAAPAEESTLTINIENKSLRTAIEEICRNGKLNYTVDDHGVIITGKSVVLGDSLEARNFAFNTEDKDPEALKAKFAPYDIDFPQGSDIFFDKAINRLVVINTPDNLRKIELAISDMEAPDVMIQIMLKFVEIEQNNLDELAFNWQIAVNANNFTGTAEGQPASGSAAAIRQSSNELLRYYRPEGVTGSPQDNAQLNWSWQNGDGTSILASLFALNWADSKDVLASPRVTTLADQEATIDMVKKQYFPSSFELIDVETSESEQGWHMTGADPQPQLDNEQELGIKLSITPSLKTDATDPNGEARVIVANVKMPIKTFYDWMIFDARSTSADGTSDGEYYKMPMFDERTIETDIELYDGQTIVLGGVTTDTTESIHDKIPILGDIPFVGRFFRSEYTKAVKSNLLIFMTCRMVKPDGSAKYEAQKRNFGLPEFSRNQ